MQLHPTGRHPENRELGAPSVISHGKTVANRPNIGRRIAAELLPANKHRPRRDLPFQSAAAARGRLLPS